jgi:hypothetical protein
LHHRIRHLAEFGLSHAADGGADDYRHGPE